MISEDEAAGFDNFRDSLSSTVIAKLAPSSGKRKRAVKGRKNEIKPVVKVEQSNDPDANDAAELGEFVEYLAEEIFTNLPRDLRELSYRAVQDEPELAIKFALPLESALLEDVTASLSPTIADSLCTYGLLNDRSDLDRFLEPVLESYITATTSPPPEYTPAVTASRPAGCEICAREHLPLTYHHLIPRQMHVKVVKRGWHSDWELNKVAWLCRACHSYVHKIATNEELARELYSVDLLLERSDVQKWADWVGRVRWKAR